MIELEQSKQRKKCVDLYWMTLNAKSELKYHFLKCYTDRHEKTLTLTLWNLEFGNDGESDKILTPMNMNGKNQNIYFEVCGWYFNKLQNGLRLV